MGTSPTRPGSLCAVLGSLLLVALPLVPLAGGCSANRDQRLPSECITDTQCGSAELCQAGTCTRIDGESTSVIGKVAGAPEGAEVSSQPVADEVCEMHSGQGLVCTLAPGGSVILIAPVLEGYRFTGWTGQGCESAEPTLSLASVQASTVCVANYARRYRVRGSVEGEPGLPVAARSDSAGAVCVDSACQVDPGELVTLHAPVRDGFRVSGFEGTGCEQRTGYSVAVRPLDRDVSCVAKYLQSLTVRGQLVGLPADSDAAIVASSPDTAAVCESALCAVEPGATVVLRAPSVPGFRFRGWTGDERCLGDEPELKVERVLGNVVCTADYAQRFVARAVSEGVPAPLAVIFSASSEGVAAACQGASCEVDRGDDVLFLAGSAAGYRLASWSGEGCAALSGAAGIARAIAADVTCTAHYVPGVSVVGTVVNAQAEVDARSTSAGAACASGRCSIDAGGSVLLTAPGLPGRTFSGWSGDPGCSGGELAIALSDVASSKHCLASFARRYAVTGRAAPSLAGSVLASSPALNASCAGTRCQVDDGAPVSLSASSNAGFRFSGWSGAGCVGSAPLLALPSVRGNLSCVANFVPRVQVSGEVLPQNSGTVSAAQASSGATCSGASCTVDAGSDVVLSAAPAEGYRFTGWSGCAAAQGPAAGKPALSVFGALADVRCSANFERITFLIAALPSPGGSVEASSGGKACPNAACTVGFGDSAELRASPDVGYTFAGWTGCSGSGTPLTRSNVRAAETCTATFARIRVTLSGSSLPAGLGPISARSESVGAVCAGASCTVDYGSSVQLGAASNPSGYRFGSWAGCDGAALAGPLASFASLTSTRSCQALYVKVWTVTGIASGPGTVDCASGCAVDEGGQITLTATPAPNYNISGWSCSPGLPSSVSFSDVRADLRCEVTFSPILL